MKKVEVVKRNEHIMNVSPHDDVVSVQISTPCNTPEFHLYETKTVKDGRKFGYYIKEKEKNLDKC